MWKRIKSFFSKAWKTVVATIGIAGVIWGVFEGAFYISNWFQKEDLFRQNFTKLSRKVDSLAVVDLKKTAKIDSLTSYVERKQQSFQVRIRIYKELDEVTGQVVFIKKYRDELGVLRLLHYDRYHSEIWQVDYYFYIDDNGEKVYING
jgi:hypothetical protein